MKEKNRAIYNAAKAYRKNEESQRKPSDYDFGVDSEYINSFYKDFQAYHSEAEKDYNGISYGSDVSGLYDKHSSTMSSLRNRSDNIRAYLNANKKNLKSEDYTALISDLNSVDDYFESVGKAFQGKHDYFSQWKTEDDYNAAIKSQEEYEVLKTVNLDDLLNEKNHLERYVNAVDSTKKEVQKLKSEISVLEFSTNKSNDADIRNQLAIKKTRLARCEEILADAEEKGYEKQYADVSTKYNRAKYIQDGIKLTNDALNAEDFEEKSRYVSTHKDGFWDRLIGNDYDTTYEYINDVDGMRYKIENKLDAYQRDSGWDDGESTWEEKGYDLLNDDEIKVYNYYYSTQGKEKAEEYLNSIQETLYNRKAEGMFGKLEDNTLLELAFGIEAGLDQFASGVKNLFNTTDDYIPVNAIQQTSGKVREDLADDSFGFWYNFKTGEWEDKAFGSSLGQVGYDSITTTSNMLPSILVAAAANYVAPGVGTYVGAATLGASAAGNAYQEMVNLGYDKGQARTYSTLVGLSEAGLSAVLSGISSLGGKLTNKAISNAIDGIDNGFARFAIDLGGKLTSEGLEEGLQEIINPLLKNAIFHADENIDWSQVAYSALLGSLSALGMEGVPTAARHLKYNSAMKQHGQNIVEQGGVDAVKDVALKFAGEIGGREGKALAKSANAITNNSKARDIGVLADRVNTARSKLNKADIQSALVQKGVSKAQAKNYANILVAMNEEYFNGDDSSFTLGTDEQWRKMTGDENAYSILKEIVTNSDSAANIRNRKQSNAMRGIRMDENGQLNEEDVKQFRERVYAKVTDGGLDPDVQNDFAVSVEGKTIVDGYDGEVQKLKFVDGENGGLKMNVNGDADAELSSIAFGDIGEALVVSSIVKMGIGASDANAIYSLFKGKGEKAGNTFSKGVGLAFKYGRYHYSPQKLNGIVGISRTAAQVAFNAGQNSVRKTVEEAKSKLKSAAETNAGKGEKIATKGSVVFEGKIADKDGNLAADEKSLTDIQRASVEGLKLLAELSPLNFHIFQSEKDGKTFTYVKKNGQKTHANGWYRVGTNDIYIDLNAGSLGQGVMMETAAHEISHFIKEYSPEKWNDIAKYIMDEYVSKYGDKVDVLLMRKIALVKARADSKSKTQQQIEDEAFEELVCDSLSRMLIDGTVVEAMANIKQKNKSVWNTIKKAVQKLLDKWSAVINQYKDRTADAEEAIYFSETSKSFKKLQEMLAEAFVDASDTYSKVGSLEDAQKNQGLKDSSRSKRDLEFRKKSYYNEFNSKAMQWVNKADRQSGDNTIIYDGKRRKYVLLEAMEEGYFEVTAGTYEEVSDIYERVHEKQNRSIYGSLNRARAGSRAGMWDMQLSQNRGNDERDAGSSGSQRLQTDTAGNDEHLLRGDQGESVKESSRFSSAQEAYTEEQYNAFGWASYNGVITANERETLLSRYADFKHNCNKYPVTRWGEAVIHSTETPDVIMYVKGPIECPIITKIVRVNTAIKTMTEDDVIWIREEIVSNERNRSDQPFKSVEDFYGYEFFSIGKARDYASFRKYQDSLREGRGGQESDSVGAKVQDGGRSGGSGVESDSANGDGGVKESSRRDYSYDALVSKPDMPVTTVSGNIPTNRADIVAAAKRNAAQVGKTNKDGSVSVHVNDIDTDVIVTKKSLVHGLDRRIATQAPVLSSVGEVLQNAIRINELNPRRGDASATYALIGAAKSNDGLYIASFIVNRFTNEVAEVDVLYSVNAKKGSAALPPKFTTEVATPTDPTISISNLLDYVNQYFPDILPEDVLKHYGHTERPAGSVGKDALYSERGTATSDRSLLANALKTTIDINTPEGQIALKRLEEYQEMIGTLDDLNSQLIELREGIFSKGVDGAKRKQMREDAAKIANRISIYDKKLLTLEASKPLKKVLDRERSKATKLQKKKDAQLFASYKEEAEKKRKAEAEYYREIRKKAVEKLKESKAKTDARDKLQKLVLKTVKWISYPKQDEVKCPDILRVPYANFLRSIDLSSKTFLEKGEKTKKDLRIDSALSSLARAIEKIETAQNPEAEGGGGFESGYLDLPASFVDEIRDKAEEFTQMVSAGGDVTINGMSAKDIKEITKLIRTLNHSIREMSTLYSNMRFSKVEEIGKKTISYMEELGNVKSTNAVNYFVAWENALPYYAFKRFGEGGESIFEELMDAQDKMAFLAKTILDFREKSWTSKESKVWSEDTHTIELSDGKTLTLTTADAMSIYCLSRRDNEQGLRHLVVGGVRVPGQKKGAQTMKDSRANLDLEDVMAICASLNDRQKEVAESIQEFMSSVCSDWGNEISMKRFLTKDFTEKQYFPIQSNDEVLAQKDPQAQQTDLYRLLNISAAKPITPKANNSVVVRNIFDVFTEHTSDMARLNAYGMALLDYMKWINYNERSTNEKGQISVRGVRSAMNDAYGDKAKLYVINLIKDINGRFSDNGDHPWLTKALRNAKTAAVGSSLRTAVLQLTSYPRAAMVLSVGNLVKGMSRRPQISKAKDHCGIALWKSFGFYDTNIARSIEDQIKGTTNWKQKLIELSLKGAEWGDAITWGYLWNACEYDVANSNKQLKPGTEEFDQAVAKKLREVVYATQVVDSVLTKTQIMRSKSALTQTATAFMSEPAVTYNILMDSGFQFNLEKRRTGSAKLAWQKTGRQIIKSVTVFGSVQVLTALVESLIDAYRDDDDEEFVEKFSAAMSENLISDILVFNKLPIISDLIDGVLSFFGMGYFSTDRMDTAWMSDLITAATSWKKVLGEAFGTKETSLTVYKALYDTATAVSTATGVAYSGLVREIVTLWNNTAGAADPDLKIKKYDE